MPQGRLARQVLRHQRALPTAGGVLDLSLFVHHFNAERQILNRFGGRLSMVVPSVSAFIRFAVLALFSSYHVSRFPFCRFSQHSVSTILISVSGAALSSGRRGPRPCHTAGRAGGWARGSRRPARAPPGQAPLLGSATLCYAMPCHPVTCEITLSRTTPHLTTPRHDHVTSRSRYALRIAAWARAGRSRRRVRLWTSRSSA